MILADRIKKIREAKKMTQEEVAFKCNISTSAYGQIERKASTSSYETLSKIATALDVSILFLLDIKNPEYLEKNKL
jgi:transcriptional regulator with XRE-family HTH domain